MAAPLDTSLPGPQLAVRAPPYRSWLLSVLLAKRSDRGPQLVHNVKYASIVRLLSSLLHFLGYKIFGNTALVHMHWEYLESFWTLEVLSDYKLAGIFYMLVGSIISTGIGNSYHFYGYWEELSYLQTGGCFMYLAKLYLPHSF